MSHNHSVIDNDIAFTINEETRDIVSNQKTNLELVQYDHNSEQYTFKIPRNIEGHDMTLCNVVQIHFINVGGSNTNEGVYEVTDFAVDETDTEFCKFTWLVSQNATRYAGKLSFLIRFACTQADGTLDYAYHTNIFSDITVSDGMNNGEIIVEKYVDILEAWKTSVIKNYALADHTHNLAHIETRPISLVGITTSSNPDTSIIEENKLTSTSTTSTIFYITHHGQADIEVISSVRATLYVDGKTVGSLSANTPFTWSGIVNEQIRVSFRSTAGEITFTKFLGDVYVDGLMSGKQLRSLENARMKTDPVYVGEYVTPEQYGAVGDGTTDDSAAIQAAIDTNKRVVLSKTYRIENTLNIKKNNQILTIDGKLIVACGAGIELKGACNTIDGGGTIEINSAMSESTAIRILNEGSIYRGNVISVRKLIDNSPYKNIGIEITGGTTKGGACFDRITSDIEEFRYGIWSHPSEGQSESTWYKGLFIDSSITKCVQAVIFDYDGEGSIINGNIQPLITSTASENLINLASSLPLIKVSGYHCRINAIIWDLPTMANRCAVEVDSYYTQINSTYPNIENWVEVPEKYASRTYFPCTQQKVKTLIDESIGEALEGDY